MNFMDLAEAAQKHPAHDRIALADRPFEEIKGDAFQLPEDERLNLAYALFRDLEKEGFEIDWDTPEVVGVSTEARTTDNEVP